MIRSVTRYLLITQISFLFLVLVVLVCWNYLDSYKEIEGIFDAQLSRSAHTLNSLLSFADEEGYLESIKLSMSSFEEHLVQQDFSHSFDRRIIFQIWREQGGLLLKSSLSPDIPLTSASQGFVEEILNEQVWRVYVFSHPLMKYRFYVAERSDLRREVATKLALRSTLPLFILFPILAFIIWRSIVRALTFIDSSAKRIEEEVPENLEPISLEEVPTEVHPLIRALNGLFVKITESYEREKRFSADAAHELRTPLTAIKTQAQVAMREADPFKRHKALENVVKGVDAAAHLAEQLLSLSRLEDDKIIKRDLNLVDLINDCVQDIRPLAREKSLKLKTTFSGKAILMNANDSALCALVRNLLDNAIKYSDQGGEVQILCQSYADEIRLCVLDTGQGIPDLEKERVLERFHRGLGHKEQGSGLGLSIVQRSVEMHGGRIKLTNRKDGRAGLRVEVVFPNQVKETQMNHASGQQMSQEVDNSSLAASH